MGQSQNIDLYHTKTSPIPKTDDIVVKNKTELYDKMANVKIAEGYKDLHSLVFAFFGQDKSKYGFPKNEQALFYTLFYVLSMCVLCFHLWHGFASAYQTVGVNHSSYNTIIKSTGKLFAILFQVSFEISSYDSLLPYLNEPVASEPSAYSHSSNTFVPKSS